MRRSSSLLTSGRRRTPRTTLKIAALAPMPSARVTMTVIASPLTLANDRAANLKSVMRLIGVQLARVMAFQRSPSGWQAPSRSPCRSSCPCSSTLKSSLQPATLLRVQLSDRPHFDAPLARRRDFRGHLDCVVQVSGLDEVEPSQMLLRLGERAVGD